MEDLEYHFVSNVTKVSAQDEDRRILQKIEEKVSQKPIEAVDLESANNIRQHIGKVLGTKFSPVFHPPPELLD